MKFSPDGVSLNEQKTEALKEFKIPRNASELHSFLGLSVYASKWIKNLATIAEPLWKLTKKDVRWEWTPLHQESFDNIKSSLVSNIGFFKLDWGTELVVDASPVGLGAVLLQSNPSKNDEKVPIIYISRLLSKTERNYSQVEKEALACVWACERLENYLLGKQFELYTDNKAMSLILSNPLANPPARIKRWKMRLSPFDMVIKHVPGSSNISDFLSRHPMAALRQEEDDTEAIINTIVQYARPSYISHEKLLEATLSDPEMIELSKMIKDSSFKVGKELAKYEQVFSELCLTDDGLILRDTRILIPILLQNNMINIAHQGHLGITMTKRLLRSKVWFPNMQIWTSELKQR